MTWASFVDFWIMRELGQEDTIMRNYDLLRFTGKGEIHLALALRRAGIDCEHSEPLNYIPVVIARLKAMGFKLAADAYEKVRIRLIGWYAWDRIRKGDVQKWYVSLQEKGA